MKEDRLIQALVRDLQPARAPLRGEYQIALFLLWSSGVGALFLAGTGVSTGPALIPILACLVMLVAATIGAITSSFPGRGSWRVAAALVVAAAAMWTAAIAFAAFPPQTDRWGSVPWVKCFGFTTGVAVVISFGLATLLRRGWPLRARVTTSLALAASASAAALTTTLQCPSNAPFHVLLGHVLPILLIAGLGPLFVTRLFLPSVARFSEDTLIP